MGDADFIYRGWGAVVSPIRSTDVENEQLFSVCDPLRDRLLALFANAINYELGHHISQVKDTSPWYVARLDTVLAGALPVADTFWREPTPELLREAKVLFPLLALYRGAEEGTEETLDEEAITCTWGLHYVLGQLSPQDARRLSAARVLVHRLVKSVISNGGHAAYEGGARQFFSADKGNLSEIKVTNCAYEPPVIANQPGDPNWYAAHMTLQTKELEREIEDADAADFEGITIHAGLGGDGGVLPGHFDAESGVMTLEQLAGLLGPHS